MTPCAARTRRRARARRFVALSVALAVVLAMVAGCGSDRPGPDGGGSATTVHEFAFDGLERSYRLHVPAHASGARPLVVVLHGGFGSGQQAELAYGWDALADREGFLVAYPDGWRRAWNTGGGCCGASADQRIDDVGFLETVVQQVRRDHDVDGRRIYLTGMSNGAMMAYTMACRTRAFAAIAPVAGTQLVDCPDAAPVSVVHVHGLADTRVRYDGGPGEGVAHVDGPPVDQVVAGWRAVDRCAAPSVTTSGVVRTSTATCARGRAVTLITIEGAGHQWPGSEARRSGRLLGADPPSHALDATSVIWQFFASHPKP